MDYYNRTNPAQALACGYPAGMGQIPVQADGLGYDGSGAVATTIDVAAMLTPWVSAYAARKHGYGWPATIGIFFGSGLAMGVLTLLTGLGGLAVPVAAGYYAFKD